MCICQDIVNWFGVWFEHNDRFLKGDSVHLDVCLLFLYAEVSEIIVNPCMKKSLETCFSKLNKKRADVLSLVNC